MCYLQYAAADAAAGRPWAGGAVAALVRDGLGCFQLAHAEAAAQAALSSTAGATQPDPAQPHATRSRGAIILKDVNRSLTPHLARALANERLVLPLLQVQPRTSPGSCHADPCRVYCQSSHSTSCAGVPVLHLGQQTASARC